MWDVYILMSGTRYKRNIVTNIPGHKEALVIFQSVQRTLEFLVNSTYGEWNVYLEKVADLPPHPEVTAALAELTTTL